MNIFPLDALSSALANFARFSLICLVFSLPALSRQAQDVQYTYDALGRLETVIYKGLASDGTDIKYTYGYDPAGNRKTLLVEGTADPAIYLRDSFVIEGQVLKVPVFVTSNPRGDVSFDWEIVTGDTHVQSASRSGHFSISNVDAVGYIGEIQISTQDDNIKQGRYQIEMQVSQPDGVIIDPATDTYTHVIQDNDVTYFVIADENVVEGGDFEFSVNRVTPSSAVPEDITVTFEVEDLSAILEQDYKQVDPVSVQFLQSGSGSQTVMIETYQDAVSEPEEALQLKANWTTEGFVSTSWAKGTIFNGPSLPASTFAIESAPFKEDAGTVSLKVLRNGPTGRTYDVAISVVGGTASDPADYTLDTGPVLQFAATERDKPVHFTLQDDGLEEAGGETVVLQATWFNPETGEQTTTGTLTINDPGAGGGTNNGGGANPPGPGAPVPVADYETLPLTGTGIVNDGQEIYEGSGTFDVLANDTDPDGDALSIVPGSIVVSSSFVPTSGPSIAQINGRDAITAGFAGCGLFTFDYQVTDGANPVAAQLNVTTTGGANCSTPPTDASNPPAGSGVFTLPAQSPSITEGGKLEFIVDRSGTSQSTATVNYSLSGTAIAGTDYEGGTSGTLTFFSSGSKTIEINTINDIDVVDGDKTVTVTLTNPTIATLGSSITATGTIEDNDSLDNRSPLANPDPSISGTYTVNVEEQLLGDGDYLGQGTFDVLANDGDLDDGDMIALVSVAPLDGFTGLGSVSIQNNQVVADFTQCGLYRFTYTIEDQHEASASSILSVNATGDSGCPLAANGGEPQPDPVPGATISNAATVTEGGSLSFPVSLSRTYPAGVQVVWNVTSGASDVSTASGVLIFNVGDPLTKSIVLDTIDNGAVEGGRSVAVTLSASSANATLGSPSSATGAVNDNDSHPAFSISDAGIQLEGNDLVYTVSKIGSASSSYSVDYAIALTSAQSGDIGSVAMSGTLNFGSGTSSQTITVPVVDDSTWEQAEVITVTLSNPSGGATIVDGSGFGQIQNNDGQPIINIFNTSVSETAGAVNVTIFLQGGTSVPVTVGYTTADGSATAGSDYTATSGSVTIQPGSYEATVSIPIINDSAVESPETFGVNVTSAVNAVTVSSGINANNPNKGSNGTVTINSEDVQDVPVYTYSGVSWSGVCSGSGTTGTEYGSYTQYCTLSPSGASCGTQTLSTSRSCSIPQTNVWSCGSWGGWQGACGGTQTRYRTCTCTQSPSGNSCGSNTESSTRTCNKRTYSDGPVSWGACSSSGTRTGTYTRTCTWVPSGNSCGSSTRTTSGSCTPSYTYSWSTGSWSAWQCTGTGNIQERSRSATCIRSDGASVSGGFCGSAPSTYQTRTNSFCSGQFEF